MLTGGYIKLHRKMMMWEWYKDITVARVFLHLLLTVNYEPQEWHGKTVQRGQRVTSYQELAKELEMSKSTIYRVLKKLEDTKEVRCETPGRYTVITIINYDKYQDREPPEAERTTPDKYSSVRKPTEPPKSGPINPQTIAEEFNKICTSLEPIGELTYHQAHAVAFAATFLDGRTFTELFEKVERSDCLAGRLTPRFKATFDWIMRPVNLEKILSGQYDENYEKGRNKNGGTNKPTSEPDDFVPSTGFRE